MVDLEDIVIRIMPLQDNGYPCEVLIGTDRPYPGCRLNAGNMPTTPHSSNPKTEGQRIWDWLFADEQFRTNWAKIEARNHKRKIRLWVDNDDPKLHSLHWELLHNGQNFIAAAPNTPFSRYLAGVDKPVRSPVDPSKQALRILVAVAAPDNLDHYHLPPVDAHEEWAGIEAALKGGALKVGRVESPVTLQAIQKALNQEYDIFYFVGHGQISRQKNTHYLYLADEKNQVATVSRNKFIETISHSSGKELRMIYLSSCQVASSSSDETFQSLAYELVKVGVDAVLAMQGQIPIDTAQAFSHSFFERLTQHGSVDLAANQARTHILTKDARSFAVPMLVSRLSDNQLFVKNEEHIRVIAEDFGDLTRNTLNEVQPEIPGLIKPIRLPRSEIQLIENELREGKPVLLTGDAGTGKSGIVKELALSIPEKKGVLLLDAREYSHIRSEVDLEAELRLTDTVKKTIHRITNSTTEGMSKGFRLIIDQLDNVTDTKAIDVLVQLAKDCCNLDRVEVIVVARNEGRVKSSLDALKDAGFVEVVSRSLDDDTVRQVLQQLNIESPSTELIVLGKNLLNLSLIGQLKKEQPNIDLATPLKEVELWLAFLHAFQRQEEKASSPKKAEKLVAQAVELAKNGLNRHDRRCFLDPGHDCDRLISWQIIIHSGEGRTYRFRHQELQDFFYAWDVTGQLLTPKEILRAIDPHKTRGVLMWMEKLYQHANPKQLERFYRELFEPESDIPFYSQVEVLNSHIKSPQPITNLPALKAIRRMLELSLPGEGLRGYFFNRSPHSAWAQFLWEWEILINPPVDTTGSWISWDAQNYLIGVAREVPDVVAKHVTAVELWWHGSHVTRAVIALSQLSVAQIKPFVSKICIWLGNPQIAKFIAKDTFELLKILAQHYETEAFDLYFALTKPLPEPDTKRWVTATFGEQFEHKQILHNGATLLYRLDMPRLVSILEGHLLLVSQIEKSLLFNESYFSDPLNWRETIEDRESESQTERDYSRYTAGNYKDRLLRLLRDVLHRWVRDEPTSIRPILRRYLSEAESRNVFYRLALFILYSFPDQFSDLVMTQLERIDTLYFNTPFEYLKLIQSGYPKLPINAQERLVTAICEGPPHDEHMQQQATWIEQNFGQSASEYTQEKSRKEIHKRLYLLTGYLTDYTKRLEEELLEEFGVPQYKTPSLRPIEFDSTTLEEELNSLTPIELVKFIQNWQPPRKPFVLHEYEMLAEVVTKMVTSKLEHYQSVLADIALSYPIVANELLRYFGKAQNIPQIEWHLCINLCEALLANERVRTDVRPVAELGWLSVRRSILWLLEIGLRNQQNPAPEYLLERILALLLVLVDDSDPTQQEEISDVGYHLSDSVDQAIRPRALRAIIQYAVSVAPKGTPKGHGPNRLNSTVEKVLTRKLDREADPHRLVHSIYGSCLYDLHWLNYTWLVKHIDHIFPDEEDKQSLTYFVSAWDSFITSHRNWGCNDMLALLHPKYERAIDYLSKGYKTSDFVGSALAGHVGQEYLLGNYDLSSQPETQSLIVQFCHKVSVEHIAELAAFMWRWLESNQEQKQRYWGKIQAFWEWRNEDAREAGNPPERDEEIQWFACLLCLSPRQATISSLWNLIIGLLPHILRKPSYRPWVDIRKYLFHEVEHDAERVIKFLWLIHDKVSLSVWFYDHDEMVKIFNEGSRNPDSRQQALSIINYLRKQGIQIPKLDQIYKKFA